MASILKDKNDLIDKHFSDSHHIKSIYFNDEDEYVKGFKSNQHEHFSKIIEKLNDVEESMIINQNLDLMYNQYVTEYGILQKCKYMLHTVQFLKSVT